VSLEVTARFTGWDYKGMNTVLLRLHRDRTFEASARIQALEKLPLPRIGTLYVHHDLMIAWVDMPPSIFDHARAMLSCGRRVFVVITMTKMFRRTATLSCLNFTTDQNEVALEPE